jgi:hypothetical protein
LASIEKRVGKRRTSYRVLYRDPSHRVRSKSFRLRREAEVFKAAIEHSKRAGPYVDPHAGKVPFAEWFDRYMRTAGPPAATSQALYWSLGGRYLKPHFGSWPLNTITRTDVREFKADLESRDVGDSTVEHACRLLRRVLNVALDDGLIAANPAARMRIAVPGGDRLAYSPRERSLPWPKRSNPGIGPWR